METHPAPEDAARKKPAILYAAEVARLRAEAVPGAGGRLRDLFDFLAERGMDTGPATQSEIATAVFGEAHPDADDATVRVYIHRLRKRLDEHYEALASPPPARLEIPPGTYALRLAGAAPAPVASPSVVAPPPPDRNVPARTWPVRVWPLAALLALLIGIALGWALSRPTTPRVNAVWQPFLASTRPVLIVLGDYYIYGEIDPIRPEEGRLIRDFRVNSASDLERMQALEPARFAAAEDVGLAYLPLSAANGLAAVVPLLERQGKQVRLVSASALEPAMLTQYDVVYIGLLSGMGLLEAANFMGSGFQLGESYDELVDEESSRRFISGEARSLPSQAYYRDYAYVARYRAPSGALVAVLAGSRDTGLRGVSPIIASAGLPAELERVAEGDRAFEALFEITGQQGADLSERLVVSRTRSDSTP